MRWKRNNCKKGKKRDNGIVTLLSYFEELWISGKIDFIYIKIIKIMIQHKVYKYIYIYEIYKITVDVQKIYSWKQTCKRNLSVNNKSVLYCLVRMVHQFN